MGVKRYSDDSQSSQSSPKIPRRDAGSPRSLPELHASNEQAQSPRLLTRRERANFNERRRMHGINTGYDLVKSEIPSIANQKVAKVIYIHIIFLQFIFRRQFWTNRMNNWNYKNEKLKNWRYVLYFLNALLTVRFRESFSASTQIINLSTRKNQLTRFV